MAPDRAYPHPLRGTCVPECPSYSRCHCGCGEATAAARQSHTDRGMVRGMPRVFRQGHFARTLERPYTRAAPFTRCGIDARTVLPELEKLVLIYGRARRVAALLGVSEAWVSLARHGGIKRVRFSRAQAIAVLLRGTRHEADLLNKRASNAKHQRRRRAASTTRKFCACGKRIIAQQWDECRYCRERRPRDYAAKQRHGRVA